MWPSSWTSPSVHIVGSQASKLPSVISCIKWICFGIWTLRLSIPSVPCSGTQPWNHGRGAGLEVATIEHSALPSVKTRAFKTSGVVSGIQLWCSASLCWCLVSVEPSAGSWTFGRVWSWGRYDVYKWSTWGTGQSFRILVSESAVCSFRISVYASAVSSFRILSHASFRILVSESCPMLVSESAVLVSES